MKVAFTTSNGEMIDQHFGQCRSFHIWEIDADTASFLKVVNPDALGSDEEERISSRVGTLVDCAIVYTMQIGGPAAAKLVAKKIHPMKTTTEVPVKVIVGKLQEVLRGNPPPWLRKAINKGSAGAFTDE